MSAPTDDRRSEGVRKSAVAGSHGWLCFCRFCRNQRTWNLSRARKPKAKK